MNVNGLSGCMGKSSKDGEGCVCHNELHRSFYTLTVCYKSGGQTGQLELEKDSEDGQLDSLAGCHSAYGNQLLKQRERKNSFAFASMSFIFEGNQAGTHVRT